MPDSSFRAETTNRLIYVLKGQKLARSFSSREEENQGQDTLPPAWEYVCAKFLLFKLLQAAAHFGGEREERRRKGGEERRRGGDASFPA